MAVPRDAWPQAVRATPPPRSARPREVANLAYFVAVPHRSESGIGKKHVGYTFISNALNLRSLLTRIADPHAKTAARLLT